MKTLIIPVLALSFIAATAEAQPRRPAQPEALYGVTANRDGVKVRVSSNGCTKKDDFRVRATRSYPAQLSFVRTNPDRCQSFAQGSAWLTFSWRELGIRQGDFRVSNPLTAWTGPGE